MRIVTRPDFDGIVCAVLLAQAEKIDCPVCWVEPNEIQKKQADIKPGDIIANLPWAPECSMWFDHHVSNTPDRKFKGAFEIAPSAAGVVLKYYKAQKKLDNRFDELVRNRFREEPAHLVTGEEREMKTDGVFIFIGHLPNVSLFAGQIETTSRGYLRINDKMQTSVPGVYAAGEVADPRFRQVITSAGMGAAAAMQAIHDLEERGE